MVRDERGVTPQSEDFSGWYNEVVFKAELGARALHCGQPDCEDDIKAATAATPRVIPDAGEPEAGACIRCGQPSAYGKRLIFSRAY